MELPVLAATDDSLLAAQALRREVAALAASGVRFTLKNYDGRLLPVSGFIPTDPTQPVGVTDNGRSRWFYGREEWHAIRDPLKPLDS